MDDHITIIPSKRFVQILQELCDAIGALDSIKDKLNQNRESPEQLRLTTQEIKWCHMKIRERGIPARIHELISESKMVLPKYEPPPRNPELEARVQRLRKEQENREYAKMVSSVNPTKDAFLSDIGKDLKSMNRQLVSGLQYLLSIVGTFFGVFMLIGMYNPDYAVRALSGIIAALVVAIAEMFFIIREDLREEDQEKKKN